jgi:hypothetical protein
MRFMLVVHATKQSEAGAMPEPKLMEAIGKSAEELTKSGVMISTGGLTPTSMGSMVRVRNGKVTVTDGPFTEAKEILGGFAIVEVESKEKAVEMARGFFQLHADILGPSYVGSGEVRQMFGPADCGGAPSK